MWLVNVDRDCIYKWDGEEPLLTFPEIYKGCVIGSRLYLGSDKFLGDFESLELALKEIRLIIASSEDVYYISGFSNYNATDDIPDLCMLVDESIEEDY